MSETRVSGGEGDGGRGEVIGSRLLTGVGSFIMVVESDVDRFGVDLWHNRMDLIESDGGVCGCDGVWVCVCVCGCVCVCVCVCVRV